MSDRRYFKAEVISLANTAVGATLEDIGAAITLEGNYTKAVFEIANLGDTNALTDFSLMVKPSQSAGWHNLLTGTGWATVAGLLLAKTGDANTLGTEASIMVVVDIPPCHSIKFQGKSTATSVTVKGQLWRNG